MSKAGRVDLILEGGLGNQLFQYAAALELTGGESGAIHLHSYSTQEASGGFDIGNITGSPVRYPNRLRRSLVPALTVRDSWMDTVSSYSSSISQRVRRSAVIVHSDPFAPMDTINARHVVLSGFFQHPTWWTDAWTQVAQMVSAYLDRYHSFSEPTSGSAVALHVRRGDYAALGWVLPEAYYRRALTELDIDRQRVDVVSEGAIDGQSLGAWLESNGYPIAERPPNEIPSAVADFMRLARSEKTVIANSTFSWWAAAVGEVMGRSGVAYPDPWLQQGWGTAIPLMGLPGWRAVNASA